MALTGKFIADFESFYAAVQKAEVQLKGLETGAGKVSTSLNRMADSFSGRKVIQDAVLMAEAIERIGGASKLTAAEQTRATSTVEAALAKYRALGQEAPESLQGLSSALKAAATATKQLADDTAAVQAHVGAFSGGKIIQEADQIARAVAQIGGASKLTAAEQERVNTTVNAALGKYAALGQQAPKHLVDLANATKSAIVPMDKLAHEAELARQQFEHFSGGKVIDEARAMTTAVGQMGGATKLTGNEQAKVNSLLTEALAKYKALGLEAPADLKALENATRKLEPPMTLAGSAASVLQSTIGRFTIAGVAANAISSLASGLGDFAAQGLKLPAIQSSFERLTVGIKQNGHDLLANMTEGTQHMVSNIDLMQTANKAILLGLPVTSESMGELATAATTLGKAMGQDATKSIDDLITALGRSSPMILDNLGLTVKVGEANEAYARKLGKTSDQLTVAETKMAFYEAAMEAARKKTAQLGDQQPTLTNLITQGWTQIGNVVTDVAAKINVEAGKQFNLIQKMKDDLDRFGLSSAGTLKPPSAPNITNSGIQNVQSLDAALAALDNGLDKQREAAKKASDAIEAHAKSIQQLRDQLSGKGTIAAANDMVEALRGTVPIQHMTASAQETVNKTLGAALDVYKALGTTAPAAMNRLWLATAKGPAIISGINGALKDVGTQVDVTVPKLQFVTEIISGLPAETFKVLGDSVKPVAPEVRKATDSLNELAASLTQLAQIGGSAFGPILKSASALVSGLDAAAKANERWGGSAGIASAMFSDESTKTEKFAAGVASSAAIIQGAMNVWASSANDASKAAGAFHGAMSGAQAGAVFGPYGAAVGAAAGAIAGMIHTLTAGRRAVEDFAKSFDTVAAGSGFDELHAKMLKLGDEGERLWIKLTQQTKKGDKAAAARVIDEIQNALKTQQDADPDLNAGAAGYKTRADLEETAKKARSVYDYMRESGKYTATQIADAFEKAKAAQIAALGDVAAAQSDALSKLSAEYKTLSDSVGAEAEEAVMGVVETQQRARMAEIEADKKAIEEKLAQEQAAAAASGDTSKAEGQKAHDDLQQYYLDHPLVVPYSFQQTGPNPGGTASSAPASSASDPGPQPGFATGTPGLGYVDFGKQSPAWLHGREAVIPENRVGSLADQIAARLPASGAGSSDVYVSGVTIQSATDNPEELAAQIWEAVRRGGRPRERAFRALGLV